MPIQSSGIQYQDSTLLLQGGITPSLVNWNNVAPEIADMLYHIIDTLPVQIRPSCKFICNDYTCQVECIPPNELDT